MMEQIVILLAEKTIETAIILGFVIVSAIMTNLLKKFTESKTLKENLERVGLTEEIIDKIVKRAVLSMQQEFVGDGKGKVKFEKAKEIIFDKINGIGLSITEEDLNYLINAAVKEFKLQYKNWQEEPEQVQGSLNE